MSSFNPSHWSSFESEDMDEVTDAVISLGRSDRLVKLSKYYFDTDKKNWNLFLELMKQPFTESNPLIRQLEMRDKDGLSCLHYLTKSDNFELFREVILLCPDSILPYWDEIDIVDYVLAYGNSQMKEFMDSITLVDVMTAIDLLDPDLGPTVFIGGPYYKEVQFELLTDVSIDSIFDPNATNINSASKYAVTAFSSFGYWITSIELGNVTVKVEQPDSGTYHIDYDGRVPSVPTGRLEISVQGQHTDSDLSGRLRSIQIFTRDLRNVALGKKATQSKTYDIGDASRVVDGVINYARFGSHTIDEEPFWEVDLDGIFDIYAIRIYSRGATSQRFQFNHFRVFVLGGGGEVIWSKFYPDPDSNILWPDSLQDDSYTFKIPGGVTGAKVMISRSTKEAGYGNIVMNEVQVFGRAKRK